MTQELEAMVIRNYATVMKKYLTQLENPIDSVTVDDIHQWQYYLVHTEKVSWSHFNQMVCALRFYFQKVRSME